MRNEGLIDSIVELLKALNIDIDRSRFVNDNVMIQCPFAHISGHRNGIDKKPSFGLKIVKNGLVFNCFTCYRKGRSFLQLVDLLIKEGIVSNKVDAYKLQNSIKVKFQDFYENKQSVENVVESNINLSVYNKLTKEFFDYNKSRGIDRVVVSILRLKYDAINKEIIFPCYNYSDKLLGFVKRGINGGYRNNIDTGQSLYLEWLIEKNTIGIVVEGMYDAARVYQLLYQLDLLDKYSVVGLYGAKVSKGQISLLGEYFDRLILMGDNDIAGIRMEKTIYYGIRKKVPLIKKAVYECKDPAGIKTAKKLNHYLKSAKLYSFIS